MTIIKLKAGLFNTDSYSNPDRRYDSLDFVKGNSFIHDGFVFGNKQEMSVTNPAGLAINVNLGLYNIGGHYLEVDTIKAFTLLPTSAGRERYDIVVAGLTRETDKVIEGINLSREGYVRVIEGVEAPSDTAVVPFASLINEEFTSNSGTKEVELAIIKVNVGTISEINDRRISTSTEEIKTYNTKKIVNGEIDCSEFKLTTISEVDSQGIVLSGSALELIGKEIEVIAYNYSALEIDTQIPEKILIKINGQNVSIPIRGFLWYRYSGNGLFNFQIKKDGDQLFLKQKQDYLVGLDWEVFSIDLDHDNDLESDFWKYTRSDNKLLIYPQPHGLTFKEPPYNWDFNIKQPIDTGEFMDRIRQEIANNPNPPFDSSFELISYWNVENNQTVLFGKTIEGYVFGVDQTTFIMAVIDDEGKVITFSKTFTREGVLSETTSINPTLINNRIYWAYSTVQFRDIDAGVIDYKTGEVIRNTEGLGLFDTAIHCIKSFKNDDNNETVLVVLNRKTQTSASNVKWFYSIYDLDFNLLKKVDIDNSEDFRYIDFPAGSVYEDENEVSFLYKGDLNGVAQIRSFRWKAFSQPEILTRDWDFSQGKYSPTSRYFKQEGKENE